MAFKIAGSMAFKDAAKQASPVLLEPIMQVEVVTPEEYMGDVHRRPQLAARPDRGDGGAGVVAGDPRQRPARRHVRLRDRPALHTQGRATYTMQFARYEEVPSSLAEEIMAKVAGRAPARAGSR